MALVQILKSLINAGDLRQRGSHLNVTSRFCNHFIIILTHLACRGALTTLELNQYKWFGDGKENLLSIASGPAISKKLISRHGKNENTVKGKPMKTSRSKLAKVLFFIDKYAKL